MGLETIISVQEGGWLLSIPRLPLPRLRRSRLPLLRNLSPKRPNLRALPRIRPLPYLRQRTWKAEGEAEVEEKKMVGRKQSQRYRGKWRNMGDG